MPGTAFARAGGAPSVAIRTASAASAARTPATRIAHHRRRDPDTGERRSEDRLDADLALGRQHELIPELEGLIGRHPLRERLHGQLMLALYRSGRQADALQAYANTRHLLVEQLGIEPGRNLKSLERAILLQDSSLELLPSPAGDATAGHAPAGNGRAAPGEGSRPARPA